MATTTNDGNGHNVGPGYRDFCHRHADDREDEDEEDENYLAHMYRQGVFGIEERGELHRDVVRYGGTCQRQGG